MQKPCCRFTKVTAPSKPEVCSIDILIDDLMCTLSKNSCRLSLTLWKAEAVGQSRCPDLTVTDMHIRILGTKTQHY